LISIIETVKKSLNLTRTVKVINLSQFLQTTQDDFILTRYLSPIYINRGSGSGQISAKETIKSFAGICKNCAMVACRRDNFVAKEPGSEPADCATNVYSLNRRAVIVNSRHETHSNHLIISSYR
jgi:hypothetical protein